MEIEFNVKLCDQELIIMTSSCPACNSLLYGNYNIKG